MAQALTADQLAWIEAFIGVRLEPGAAPNGGLADEVARLRKLVAQWQAAEAQIEGDVDKLRSALKDFFDGDEAQASMEQEFEAHVQRLFTTLDSSLEQELEEAASAGSVEALAPVKSKLSQTVGRFMQQVAADQTIALFDDNPYVKLSLRATCESALSQMASHLS